MIKTKYKRIGLIGDMHMGKHDTERWIKTYDDLKELIKETYKGKVDTLMFLGDIFDGHKAKTTEKAISFKMLNYIHEYFVELSQDFKIVMYAGNHCCYYKDRCDVSALAMFRGLKNITVVEETTVFSSNGKQYKIVPWACDPSIGGHVDGIFGHFDIKTFKLNSFKIAESGFDSKDLFQHCDRVFTGHYHHYQTRKYAKGKRSITYLGTPLQLNWAEAGKESYLFMFDLAENKISDMVENTISPKFIKTTASKLINDEVNIDNAYLDIEWDVEYTDEAQTKIDIFVGKHDIYNINNNMKQQFENIALEIKETQSAVSEDELVELYTETLEKELGDKFGEYEKSEVISRAVDYITRTKK